MTCPTKKRQISNNNSKKKKKESYEEHPRDGNECKDEKDDLDRRLTIVERHADLAGREEHVNEHCEERGGSKLSPGVAPLVDDAEDEVTKDLLKNKKKFFFLSKKFQKKKNTWRKMS